MLELTIAMSFVALLAGGIALTVSTCLRASQWSQERTDLNQEARSVVAVIARDLRGAYLGLNRDAGFFFGEPAESGAQPFDYLELSALSSNVSVVSLLPDQLRPGPQESRPPISDYVGVSYGWLDADQEAPAGLYRTTWVVPVAVPAASQQTPSGPPTSELISPRVTSLQFRYLTRDGWQTQYDAAGSANHVPIAVAIKLGVFDAHGREHEYESVVAIASP